MQPVSKQRICNHAYNNRGIVGNGIFRPCKVVGPSAWAYNWATLFLGDINTGIWPSRLEESLE
jgi:hypothetical protein